MRISLFTNYGALNSKPVFESLAIGLNLLGNTIIYNDMNADIFVIWSVLFSGKMAQNKVIWDYAKKNNIPIIVLEVGGLKRNITWKIGINGINTLPQIVFQNNRAEKLGIFLSDWKKSGDHVLICGQRPASNQWNHGDIISWLLSITKMIKQYTNRKIIFRPHPREPFKYDMSYHGITVQHPKKIENTYDDFDFNVDNTWMVISPSSTPGIHAIINGVPVSTDKNSLAHSISTPLSMIENPCYHVRTQWLEQVCHTEWTISEIKDPEILSAILVDVL